MSGKPGYGCVIRWLESKETQRHWLLPPVVLIWKTIFLPTETCLSKCRSFVVTCWFPKLRTNQKKVNFLLSLWVCQHITTVPTLQKIVSLIFIHAHVFQSNPLSIPSQSCPIPYFMTRPLPLYSSIPTDPIQC